MHQIDSREIPLDAVASMITDGDHRPPPRVASGVPHLTAKHVRKGRLMFDGCTFVRAHANYLSGSGWTV